MHVHALLLVQAILESNFPLSLLPSLSPPLSPSLARRPSPIADAGKTAEAVTQYRKALALEPQHRIAQSNLRQILERATERPAPLPTSDL